MNSVPRQPQPGHMPTSPRAALGRRLVHALLRQRRRLVDARLAELAQDVPLGRFVRAALDCVTSYRWPVFSTHERGLS